ncbi:MAG: hypothetical protein HC781_20555 [Leptolyngbyaceae cyanobacterium CSU_1_4]|nr:hypothetical protein [Leptolyngbyaceae cyanobacterium CSU_1_4]
MNAFSHPYLIQDDARQHIFWMHRFIDPTLFPNDIIADYFQAINPKGYGAFYYLMAQLGLEPLLLAKLLPIILGLITSAYCFGVVMQLFPVPFGAFLTTLILNQGLWMRDEIITGTSRAFLYPLFLAFIYYLLKQSLIACLTSVALQAVFYPPLALVEAGTLLMRLVKWKDGRPQLSRHRSPYVFGLLGAGAGDRPHLNFFPNLSTFNPMVTAAQMQAMPEFGAGGRLGYFNQDFWQTWISGDSAILPRFVPPIILLSVLFRVFRSSTPLSHQVSQNITLLRDLLYASLCLFLLAHILLPRLYFPSRFTGHSFWFAMVITAGIGITLGLERLRIKLLQHDPNDGTIKLAIALISLFALANLLIPFFPSVFLKGQSQIIGGAPKIYQFFAQQPKDILIASLAEEIDNIPAFSKRSILVSKEYALPFHLGYYNQIRQRAIDLINAQYSPTLSTLQNFIRKYNIDFLLVDRNAFQPEAILNNPGLKNWLMQFQPATNEAIARLQKQEKLAIVPLIKPCTLLKANNLSVLDAQCLLSGGTVIPQKSLKP